MRVFKFIYFCSMLSALWCAAGCVTIYNPATGRNETYFIDDRTEVSIGRNMVSEILNQTKKIDDLNLNQKVKTIGDKLTTAGDRKNLLYHYYILDDKEINAFALPGGYVFINKGLLNKVNDDELAFVLGHELGHIAARHSVKRLQNTMGINLLLNLASYKINSQLIDQAMRTVYSAVTMGFSRKDELLADSLGLKYLVKAGYDSCGAIDLLKLLQEEEKQSANQLIFLSSHPSATQRIAALQAQILSKQNEQVTE